jgi:hypothetical protein
LWKVYNYLNYGIIGEPYFDTDFNEVFYITDAGRAWNNKDINKRDKVKSKYNFTFNHTNDIINALKENKLPDKIMVNIHPEFWTDETFKWYRIYLNRKLRNTVKKIILRNK